MDQQTLIPHLFRTEFGKITAVLSKLFGFEHVEIAEDIASETFLAAMESWPYKGVPPNPVAWLYTVAKNKAMNHISRHKLFADKVMPNITVDDDMPPEIDLSESNIADSQLQMLFAICHPTIPAEAQIGLALRILCGFGIDEIANAFLSNKETINKRLFRAKEKLRADKVPIAFPSAGEITRRLGNVSTTLYLLFNEGYYSESKDSVLREDLCAEAMRLTALLMANPQTDQPGVNALFALMCFHSSRFAARKDASGQLILYNDQSEDLWDRELIAKGAYHLHRASQGDSLSKYHLEAGIAYWHTQKTDTPEKWDNILQLYNRLLQIAYSPVAALNRTYALAKVKGHTVAIVEAEKLGLHDAPFYHALLGELYRNEDGQTSKTHFETALGLAKTQADKNLISRKLDDLMKRKRP